MLTITWKLRADLRSCRKVSVNKKRSGSRRQLVILLTKFFCSKIPERKNVNGRMFKMAESTQIRIDLNVKQRLETYRNNRHCKTHSDAIERLMNEIAMKEENEARRAQEDAEEKQRRGREDITLGEELKRELIAAKEEYGLADLKGVISLLLHHFSESDSISKSTAKHLITLNKH